jgi:hypothetical protein
MTEKIDITPTPRILRTLGEIPFQPWQCLAELVDNAVDAFAEAERAEKDLDEKKSLFVEAKGATMLEEALNYAAKSLPDDGSEVQISVENGAAWVILIDGNGNRTAIDGADQSLAEQVQEAVALALSRSK